MSHPKARRVRLGLYVDVAYRAQRLADGSVRLHVHPDASGFLRFAAAVGAHAETLTVFGRASERPLGAEQVLPASIGLVALPHYGDLRDLRAVALGFAGTVRAMWRGLAGVDVVWVFGPHPFSVVLVLLALLRRRRVVLGVRQDTMAYFRSRLPGRRWRPLLLALAGVDAVFRLLGRRLPVTAVGVGIARRYGAPRANVQAMTVTLMRAADIDSEAVAPDPGPPMRLLTVGRIEPEKHPLLLVEALSRLDAQRPGAFELTWAGTGRMEEAVRNRAAELGIAHLLHLPGFVSFGPQLWSLYRNAHMLVHVSLTEGVPQVLGEAMACATPIVATDVGGVATALDGGAGGLLVPPDDVGALADAIVRMADDHELRRRCVEHGLRRARNESLEAESARVARFVIGAR